MLFKSTGHLHQLLGCMLGGAIFMLTCDILSNLPVFDNTLPINVVTALFGAPFVIWLLFRSRNHFE
jgi:iron complex transport system permease protein